VTEAAAKRASLSIHYLHEAKLGQSAARNAALRALVSDVVAFVDDDIRVTPGWVDALVEVFETAPKAAVVGGRIRLRYPRQRPGWMSPAYEQFLAPCDLGSGPRALDHDEIPVGGNMAVRRELTLSLGGFNENLGHQGRVMMGSDEVELFERARAAGWELWYTPASEVWHVVPPARLTARWMLRRQYYEGAARALMATHAGPHEPLELHHKAVHTLRRSKRGPIARAVRQRSVDPLLDEAFAMGWAVGVLRTGRRARHQ
jgi:cellulose synthase/poly-beta-1,6-N-acetylglucosamine synthase-like glycosyltransferase